MTANLTQALLWAALGCGFTWLMTTAGSAVVFFFNTSRKLMHHIFLGFAAGVMVAASVWSLLNPAIEQAEAQNIPGWIPAAGGFLLGVALLHWTLSYLTFMQVKIILKASLLTGSAQRYLFLP